MGDLKIKSKTSALKKIANIEKKIVMFGLAMSVAAFQNT
jgi:hypothetical protein